MKIGEKNRKYEDGKLYVIYDNIYDTYLKENRKNYFTRILRFPNPSILIIKALCELYNITDKVEYVSYDSNFEVIKTHSYFNGKKKSVYETLHIIYSMSKETKSGILKNNSKDNDASQNLDENKNKSGKYPENDMNLRVYYILNEFNEVYEYFLFLCKQIYDNYTYNFFINSNYNIIKGYLKLLYIKSYVSKKFNNISFETILNKFIKLLKLFNKLEQNCTQIDCVVFYVYFYAFLNIPIHLYPWNCDNNLNDTLYRKILNNGNINTIIDKVKSNKQIFFSHILIGTNDVEKNYYETYDFNTAIFLSNQKQFGTLNEFVKDEENKKKNEEEKEEKKKKKKTAKLNTDNKKSIDKAHKDISFYENTEDYIIINEYNTFKYIGYNTLKQFYLSHFYYLTILKKCFFINVKMKTIYNFFSNIAIRIIDIDKIFEKILN
ncbi:conserved Plasmodium protein, unknown function [Plasmodium berghei]|uniref:Uncharacterized protein n=2 Tax=Plasmodium berghei TaxID=5821 RepID=A0A509APJ7_PLABA|nr:conserved Plasmodium protein, unknown function [Plasmodium berghei ANKA]CXI92857.1 conserved Plasmodium protein, unknown function [Plasmodium berghei]SCM16475.1 conserved Plasmodium protein, unknown function [Plasmodium berghei]SCM18269.1 conserved Plasmodium protein, unknown function [Plasmodium berghei]SCN27697.1 conserved Plasmodium protein, unknown function [Plasmodium berghei]VUC57581.1 conserved Plasmodium protein, unknown function [Plasmodium berghei ANKA]|eukprot:XP_034423352.1 conserved Plasmodium protein, unknown function [Plasmodium berghei ANKA]